MTQLPSKIREYYQDQNLDEAVLQRIIERGQMVKESSAREPSGLRPTGVKIVGFMSITALLLVALQFMSNLPQPADITQRVLQEIHMNHEKALAVEFATDNFQVLSEKMDRLGFPISTSPHIYANYSLLGGRYCSIQGNIAAQLKIRHRDSGHIATLYITQKNHDLEQVRNQSQLLGQVQISLWNSPSMFYGLAQGSTSTQK